MATHVVSNDGRDSSTSHYGLNLSPDEEHIFSFLFERAKANQLGVFDGAQATPFFEPTQIPQDALANIWERVDPGNRGVLTRVDFYKILRLIGYYQAGQEPAAQWESTRAPMPSIRGVTVANVPNMKDPMPMSASAASLVQVLEQQRSRAQPVSLPIPPLDLQSAVIFSNLFQRFVRRGETIDGSTAKEIFEGKRLLGVFLGHVWEVSDRYSSGRLGEPEFIVAMHILSSIEAGAVAPGRQPFVSDLYNAAAAACDPSRMTPKVKAEFDKVFNSLDTARRGILNTKQTTDFFKIYSRGRLDPEKLFQIWTLTAVSNNGTWSKDTLIVAAYYMRQQLSAVPPPLPKDWEEHREQLRPVVSTMSSNAPAQTAPKSAASDLFALDQPAPAMRPSPATAVLQPQSTGSSFRRDVLPASSPPGSPTSPQRFQSPPQQPPTMFRPFVPASSFGANLTAQNTGGSGSSAPPARAMPPQPAVRAPSVMDDLLGDDESNVQESSKLTTETTELANMSNQLGNLRSQMDQTQAEKASLKASQDAFAAKKQDLENRLQQFRAQYQQESAALSTMKQQIASSRESVIQLEQALQKAMGEGQDVRNERQVTTQALEASNQEAARLKQQISQLNAEFARLKPQVEKLKLDARQQKGLVSINKKQLSTLEAERDRLRAERDALEEEAALQRDAQDRAAAPTAAAPAAATAVAASIAPLAAQTSSPTPKPIVSSPLSMNSNNPFMRMNSANARADGAATPPATVGAAQAPTPSAFDTIFGPPSAFAPSGQAVSRTGTPPTTSFIGRTIPAPTTSGMSDSVRSVSSLGQPTPSATPPLSEPTKEALPAAEPPPPPASRQFTASHLPVVSLAENVRESEASSTRAVPPGSRGGPVESSDGDTSTLATSSALHIPGSFNDEPPASPVLGASRSDDFDSAFADFGSNEASKDEASGNVFASVSSQPQTTHANQFHSEFPPIQNLEPEEDEDNSDEEVDRGFDDEFAAAGPSNSTNAPSQPLQSRATEGSASTGTTLPANDVALPPIDAQKSPPTYEQSSQVTHGGSGQRTGSNQFPPEFGGLLPAREDPTSPPPPNAPPPTDQMRAASGISAQPSFGSASNAALADTPTDVFHDASAHPASATSLQQSQPLSAGDAFDEFDEFEDLSESKEADKAGASDLDFGFSSQNAEDFNAAFDSPAASMTNTIASTQQTPVVGSHSMHQSEAGNGVSSFLSSSSTGNAFGSSSAFGNTSQSQDIQGDWDAIFSSLENSNVDTSLSPTGDPWSAGGNVATNTQPATASMPSTTQSYKPQPGRAITPGTEHDDPILKELTSKGYSRTDALSALEEYNYDISKAASFLQSRK